MALIRTLCSALAELRQGHRQNREAWAETHAIVILTPAFFGVYLVGVAIVESALQITIDSDGVPYILGLIAVVFASRYIFVRAVRDLQEHTYRVAAMHGQRWLAVAIAMFRFCLSLLAYGSLTTHTG